MRNKLVPLLLLGLLVAASITGLGVPQVSAENLRVFAKSVDEQLSPFHAANVTCERAIRYARKALLDGEDQRRLTKARKLAQREIARGSNTLEDYHLVAEALYRRLTRFRYDLLQRLDDAQNRRVVRRLKRKLEVVRDLRQRIEATGASLDRCLGRLASLERRLTRE